MSDADAVTHVRCTECGELLDVEPSATADKRTPCPACDSTNRSYHVALRSAITVTSAVKADLTVEPRSSATARPDTFHLTTGFPKPNVSGNKDNPGRYEDLPDEVISRILKVGVRLLPPDPEDTDGIWIVGVGIGDKFTPLGAGALPDVALEVAQAIELLATVDQDKWSAHRPHTDE